MKTLYRAVLALLVALFAVTLISAPAHAADGSTTPVVAFTLDPALIVGLLVSTVLPLLVGLVTTKVTHSGVKAVLLAALALVTSLLTELGVAMSNGVTYDLGRGLLLAIPTFLIAVGMHYGLWRPTKVTDKAQSVLVTAKGDDGTYRMPEQYWGV